MTRKFNIFWKSICRQSGRSAKVWKYLRILNWLAPLPSVSRWGLEESISPIFVRSGGCWVVAAIIAFPVSMPRLGRSFQSQDCVKRNAASTHLPADGRDAVGVGLEKDFRKLSNSILLWSSEHPKTRWNLKISYFLCSLKTFCPNFGEGTNPSITSQSTLGYPKFPNNKCQSGFEMFSPSSVKSRLEHPVDVIKCGKSWLK